LIEGPSYVGTAVPPTTLTEPLADTFESKLGTFDPCSIGLGVQVGGRVVAVGGTSVATRGESDDVSAPFSGTAVAAGTSPLIGRQANNNSGSKTKTRNFDIFPPNRANRFIYDLSAPLQIQDDIITIIAKD
jgi:hypothetical protein